LFGANLNSAAVVKLKREGEIDIVAVKFHPVSDKRIDSTFDLAGKSAGEWTLSLVNEDGGEVEYTKSVTLKSAQPV
jgi:hypothetical protein